ncbi:MAG TPA: PAS domain S-box protein [Anaerolineales bacterium]|nr:PAS domain S-box protein [Anaerolineales bacterium]
MHQYTSYSASPEQKWGALRIASIYLIVGGVWIRFSDEIAASLTQDAQILKQISIYKGWGYIFVTAIMLYSMIRSHTLRIKEGEKDRQAIKSRFQAIFQASPIGICITRFDNSHIIEANEAFYQMIGYTREEVVGHTTLELNLWVNLLEHAQQFQRLKERKKLFNEENIIRRKSGETLEILVSSEILVFNQEEYVLTLWTDISERKRAEEELQAQRDFALQVMNNMGQGLSISNQDRQFEFVNQAYAQMVGMSVEEIVGKSTLDFVFPEDIPIQQQGHEARLRGEKTSYEIRLRKKNGQPHPVLITGVPHWHKGNIVGAIAVITDLAEHKQAEIALQDSRAKLNSIIESAMDAIITINETQHVVLFNTAAEFMFRIPAAEALGQPISKFIPEQFRPPHEQHISHYYEYKKTHRTSSHPFQGIVGLRENGQEFPCEVSISQVQINGSTLFTAILRDMTERERAEEEIRYQASLLANVSDAIVSTDLEYRIKSWNKAAEILYGWTAEEAIGKIANELVPAKFIDTTYEKAKHQLFREGNWHGQIIQQSRDGTEWYFLSSASLVYDSAGQPINIVIVNRDITSAVKHQREVEAIVQVSAALRTAVRHAEMIPIILEQLSTLFEAEGTAFAIPDPTGEEIVVEMARGVLAIVLQAHLPLMKSISGKVITTQTLYINNDANTEPLLPNAAQLGESRAVVCVPLVAHQQTIGVLWLARIQPLTESDAKILTAVADIAANAIHRADLYEQTQQQLKRLAILHAMDAAIVSSFDLRPTLYILIEQILNRLQVDAAAVCLYNPHTLNLEYIAGNGFHNPAFKHIPLHLGEACTGQTALEHRITVHTDFRKYLAENPHTLHRQLQTEEFTKYFGIPLRSKGQIKGVLEIYQRQPFAVDESWVEFLETLGRQVAIAIDNIEMLNGIQRSKLELELAYDATIESWSRVLDLRDKETEGHSQRVTEITLKLARRLGVRDDEIVHIRRGALLHDIGKMGIPDAILLKPAKLNDEEWVIMRQHPGLAYEMLTPIAYLRPALDIPLYHHEKWDGTGYPHGLKGEQIPLAARIFALADVWDALTSDRPYRPAWSAEKTIAYIQEQAGIHFDPNIVFVFLSSR